MNRLAIALAIAGTAIANSTSSKHTDADLNAASRPPSVIISRLGHPQVVVEWAHMRLRGVQLTDTQVIAYGSASLKIRSTNGFTQALAEAETAAIQRAVTFLTGGKKGGARLVLKGGRVVAHQVSGTKKVEAIWVCEKPAH